jgi:anti-sigma factor RsiW
MWSEVYGPAGVSYRILLSDAAVGIVVIGLVGAPDIFGVTIGGTASVVLTGAVFAAVLAVPLGVFVNMAGFFVFEGLVDRIERAAWRAVTDEPRGCLTGWSRHLVWASAAPLRGDVVSLLRRAVLAPHFDPRARLRLVRRFLETLPGGGVDQRIDRLNGMMVFARSMAFVFAVAALVYPAWLEARLDAPLPSPVLLHASLALVASVSLLLGGWVQFHARIADLELLAVLLLRFEPTLLDRLRATAPSDVELFREILTPLAERVHAAGAARDG